MAAEKKKVGPWVRRHWTQCNALLRVTAWEVGSFGDIGVKETLAERGGFEPPVRFAYTRFPSVLLKPLGHLSGGGDRTTGPES